LIALDGLEEQQLFDAFDWLKQHGERVHHLGMRSYMQPAFPVLEQLWLSPMDCQSLTRLELEGQDENTLVELAPLLPQLPQLQHLKASMTIMEEAGNGPGLFCTADYQQALPAVPALEELCPQLQGLHLVIGSDSRWMDPRLEQLLPCGLKQLVLEVVGFPPEFDPASLAGCTALQQLTLQTWELDGNQSQDLATFSSLDAVRMVDVTVHDPALLPIKSKLVQYTSRMHLYWEEPEVVGQLTALTALTIWQDIVLPDTQYVLTSLTALQHLELLGMADGRDPRLPLLLQQLAGLPQLRDLRLSGECQVENTTGVSTLQQLTGLYISGVSHPELQATEEQALPAGGPWPGLLQQLPGLQRLEVDECLVTRCPGQPWWAGLTALTQLVVMQAPGSSEAAVEGVQAALAAGSVPPNLKQLVVKGVRSLEDWEEEGPVWRAQASTLPGVTVVLWQLLDHMITYELPPAYTPCPWLPGVWEVCEGP
jgi:hypothetical protein